MNKEDFPFPIIPSKKRKAKWGVFDICILIFVCIIPFLSPILGFLYLKSLDIEDKPWSVYIIVSIVPHTIALISLFWR